MLVIKFQLKIYVVLSMIYLLTCGGAGTPGGGAGSASEFGVRARKTTKSPPLDRRWPTKRPTGPNNLL